MIHLLILLAQVDPALPEYKAGAALKGALNSVGSDTLNNLMTYWAEEFEKRHPGLKTSIEGKGSSTALPALIVGSAQLGPMSRPFREKELEAFQKAKGYPPTMVRVACDAVGVFVNKNNPIEELTLEQVDAIFSKTRRRGHPPVKTWGDLGAKGEYADKPVSIYGRNSASGTYGFFKEVALLNGDYSEEAKEQPGNSFHLPTVVGSDRYAVCYTGIGYATSNIKALRIAPKAGEKAIAPNVEASLDGSYPLSRFLLIAVDKPPGKPQPPEVVEFLKLVLSKEGQLVVVKDGYFPLPEKIAAEERRKLE